MRRCSLVVAFALVAALTGCKKKAAGEASCAQVGARFLELARDDLARQDQEAAAQARTVDKQIHDGVVNLIAPMRDSLVRACQDDRWSADARACYQAATNQNAFVACDAKLTAEQRQLREQAAARGLQAR